MAEHRPRWSGSTGRRGTPRGKACGEKRPYPTPEAANEAAGRLNASEPWAQRRRGYPCPFCRQHHIGRAVGRDGRTGARRR